MTIATRYTSGFLVLLATISLAAQLVRHVELNCFNDGDVSENTEINNYCTFLVVQCLQPAMKEDATYPGVCYHRQKRMVSQIFEQIVQL